MLDSSADGGQCGLSWLGRGQLNRFKEEEFVAFEMPLPPLETQRAIVARWQAAQAEAYAAEERVRQGGSGDRDADFPMLILELKAPSSKKEAQAPSLCRGGSLFAGV